MNKYSAILSAIFITAFFSIIAVAQPTNSSPFNAQIIDSELVYISQIASEKSISYQGSFQINRTIKTLQADIDSCINSGEDRLKKIDHLLHDTSTASVFKANSDPYIYLQQQQASTLTQTAYCKFFNYRLQEIRTLAQSKMLPENRLNILQKTSPIWQDMNPALFFNRTFSPELFYQHSGINQLDGIQLIGLGLTLLFGTCIAIYLYIKVVRHPNADAEKTRGRIQSMRPISYDLLLFIPLAFLALYLNLVLYHNTQTSSDVLIINILLGYLFVIGMLRLCIAFAINGSFSLLAQKINTLFNQLIIITTLVLISTTIFIISRTTEIPLALITYSPAAYVIITTKFYLFIIIAGKKWLHDDMLINLCKRLSLVITLMALYYIGTSLLDGQPIPASVTTLMDTIYLTLFLLAFLWLNWLVFQTHYVRHDVSAPVVRAAKIIVGTTYALFIGFAWLGYHQLAMIIIPNMLITISTIIIVWEIYRYLGKLYILLNNPIYPASQKLHAMLGLEPDSRLIELYILRITFSLPIVFLAIFCLMQIWGGSVYQTAIYIANIRDGVHPFHTTIYIGSILRAANDFCALSLFGRMLATQIVNHSQFASDKHTQAVWSSVLHYITFSLAFLIALSISGISFAGIAVVAGALSVGLGFGLQHFASDFISGLFLMVNKPIRIGDHVVIDNTEGFVSKIGLFSTKVTTLTQSDVIIPNSNLITKSVTNLTFQSNKVYRLKLQIAVAASSDLNLSRQLMLDAALNNSHVIQDPPNQPNVLFELNALVLFCAINDIEERALVLSELGFALSIAFNKHNIPVTSMASPAIS